MANVKSFKETKKTISVVFDIDPNQVKKSKQEIKALLIILGYYNPLKEEMTDPNECYKMLEEIRAEGSLSWDIYRISKFLK